MGSDSHAWVVNFLEKCNFLNINVAGEFSTTVTDVPRKLYVATK